MDVTIVEITNFKPKTQNWYTFYSKKHKVHCYKFSACTSILGGEFVYFDKLGFPGRASDKTMHDQTIQNMKLKWEWGISDKGYEGADNVLTPWKGNDLDDKQKKWNYIIDSHRAIIENAFSRLKLFDILHTQFRKHNREDIHKIAYTCAQLTNVDIKHRPLRKNNNFKLDDWCICYDSNK